MKQCPVSFISGNKSMLFYLADNEYVFSTWGCTLEARCMGRNAQIVTVPQGVFNIALPASCSLSSPTYTISALSIHHPRIHLLTLQLPRPHPLNFSALIDPSHLFSPQCHRSRPWEASRRFHLLTSNTPTWSHYRSTRVPAILPETC